MRHTKLLFATLLITVSCSFSHGLFAQGKTPTPPRMAPEMTEFWEPEVKVVTPGKATANAAITAPSDAVVLFDGKDLSQWVHPDGSPAKWDVRNGVFTVRGTQPL